MTRAIYRLSSFAYIFTDSDVEWLARSLHGEGGANVTAEKASALCWSMFNRFMLNPKHFGAKSFTSFLRSFSQPINPKWARDGQFCGLGGPYDGTAFCSPDKLARRDKITIGPIPEVCLTFADDMAKGILPRPNKIFVDFASYSGMARYGDCIGGDYFVTIEGDRKRSADRGTAPTKWVAEEIKIERAET